MEFGFPKQEKLKSRKMITRLFSYGLKVKSYPFLVLWLEGDLHIPVRAGFSVPRRNFKKAVDRNIIKRRMREAYRLNKHRLESMESEERGNPQMMFLYQGKEIPSFQEIELKIIDLLERLKSSSRQIKESK